MLEGIFYYSHTEEETKERILIPLTEITHRTSVRKSAPAIPGSTKITLQSKTNFQ